MTDRLKQLHQDIRACRICRDEPEGKPLPHEPNPVVVPSSTARIVICGQAPGNRVHQSGRPFTDPSGDRLRDWLCVDEETFYDPAKFAIVPMGFCFPGYDAKGGDLPPRRECAKHWHEDLFAIMGQVRVKLLVGASAQQWHLGKRRRKTLTETVRNWRAYVDREEAVQEWPLPHPSWRNTAWIKKNSWFSSELLPELQKMIQNELKVVKA